MNEMIERVARAIAAADREDYMEDYARYDARARAAIKAMRKPTKAMLKAPPAPEDRENIDGDVGDFLDNWSARLVWRAMIDEALKD